MRSGWPSPQDNPGRHGRHPSQQRQDPYGPEDSWPGRHSGAPGGGYGYPAAPELPAAAGEYPYASYGDDGYPTSGRPASGYGDPGYTSPGYEGPAAQDAGIAGNRTVSGFVEGGQPAGYELAWDYDTPLRYDDEPAYPRSPSGAYQMPEGYRTPPSLTAGDYGSSRDYDSYGNTSIYGTPLYGGDRSPSPQRAEYNGSELSRPGIDGPGYDLSGIVGPDDFPSFGYDEPRYDSRDRAPGSSWDTGSFDSAPGGTGRRFDETSVDVFWPGEGHPSGGYPAIRDSGPLGGRSRASQPASPRGIAAGRRPSSATRMDLGFRAEQVSAYAPRFDDTQLDMPGLSAGAVARSRSAAGVLTAPPERRGSWADETSLDVFAGGLDLDDDLPSLREEPSRAVATALREPPLAPAAPQEASRRGGRRRGRSSDRRQWVALGAIAVVAVASIGVALKSFVFSGPSGPAHTISTPARLAAFERSPGLEKQMDITQLQAKVQQSSAGQASDVVSAVYAAGSTVPGQSNQQVFMFVGGHLADGNPADSIMAFEKTYPGAKAVAVGGLGGEAACTSTTSGKDAGVVSMCVFFDSDSFGTFVSPSMTPAVLASTMNQVRPGLEHLAK